MSNYTVKFSDQNKNPIEVVSQTKNDETSLSLIGRNYPGYGQSIAENFLHLLENFANTIQPHDPIEGQMWFDTSEYKLKVFDTGTWRPTNGVFQDVKEPQNRKTGDIWVNTDAQILYIFNGVDWTQIGPSFSSSLRTGSYPEQLLGTDGATYDVILMYLNDYVLEIISKDTFRPVQLIEGFDTIVPGTNLSNKTFNATSPKFNGVASSAFALKQTSPSSETVSANNFIRNDIDQITNGRLIINNDNGVVIGKTTATFSFERHGYNAVILNAWDGGKFSFNGVKNTVVSTILTIDASNNFVGIGKNNKTPTAALDVAGSAVISNRLTVSSSSTDALNIVGGATITDNVRLSNGIKVNGQSTFTSALIIGVSGASNDSVALLPASTATYMLGTEQNPFQTLYVREIRGGTDPNDPGNSSVAVYGNLKTDNGYAVRLEKSTNFKLIGSIVGTGSPFNGGSGGDYTINASLTKQAITDRTTATSVALTATLLVATVEGLQQIAKKDLLADVYPGILTTGAIIPFAGSVAPTGWLFCDGTEYARDGIYNGLFAVIGVKFGYLSASTFSLPNLNNPYLLYANTATGATVNPPPIKYMIKT
jgi:hypothetical protein